MRSIATLVTRQGLSTLPKNRLSIPTAPSFFHRSSRSFSATTAFRQTEDGGRKWSTPLAKQLAEAINVSLVSSMEYPKSNPLYRSLARFLWPATCACVLLEILEATIPEPLNKTATSSVEREISSPLPKSLRSLGSLSAFGLLQNGCPKAVPSRVSSSLKSAPGEVL